MESVGIKASRSVTTVTDSNMFKMTAITKGISKPSILKKLKVEATYFLLVMQQLYNKMIEFGLLTVVVVII